MKSKKYDKNKNMRVLNRDSRSLEEIEAYIDSLEYGKKRKPIHTKKEKSKKIIKSIAPKKRKRLSAKRLIKITASSAFVLVFLFFVLFPLMQGSMHFLVVLSGSMTPHLNQGDVVISNYIDPDEINVDDIITFKYSQNSKNCITHRVINITNVNGELKFQTKGDSNEDPDLRVISSENIIGKVGFVIPHIGYIPQFAKSVYGFIFLILLPCFLIIANEIRNISKIKKGISTKRN